MLAELYAKLPEWAKQSPVVLVLLLAGFGIWHGDLVAGRTYDATVKERDEYKDTAFNCAGLYRSRAQESAKVNDEATSGAGWHRRRGVATIDVPITPLTTTEKRAVTETLPDARPETLNRSLATSKQVLDKADIKNAQPVTTIKP